ncbi:MAG: Ig-like domain-containing protein [Pseudomonadota bacterium]
MDAKGFSRHFRDVIRIDSHFNGMLSSIRRRLFLVFSGRKKSAILALSGLSFATLAATASIAGANEPIAIWTGSALDRSFNWTGADTTINGRVVSSGGIRVKKATGNSVSGQSTYDSVLDTPAGVFLLPPAQAPSSAAPLSLAIADYAPGGSKALAAGTHYTDLSNSCVSGQTLVIKYKNEPIPTQLIWAPCAIKFEAQNANGQVTIVSTDKVHLNTKKNSYIESYVDGVVAFTTATVNKSIHVDASKSTIHGFLFAPDGLVQIAGSRHTLQCGIFGDKVKITGSKHTITGEDCGLASNTPPAANDDAAVAVTSVAVAIDVLANDTDIDGTLNTASVQIEAIAQHGTTSIDPVSGVITYTSVAGYVGVDTFTYSVADDDGDRSQPATVNVDVSAGNQAPIGTADTASTNEDVAVDIDVLGNDSDSDGSLDITSVAIVDAPDVGTAVVDPITGNIQYTPGADFFGAETFLYVVSDNEGAISLPATVTVTVTAVNDAPVLIDQSLSTAADSSIAIDLLATDADGDAVTYAITVAPSNGTLSGSLPNVTYTPNVAFSGTDSFTVTASDASSTSAPAVITVSVQAANDPPLANEQTVSLPADSAATFTLTGSDPDGDTLTFTVVTLPTSGAISGSAPSLTYTPDAGFVGVDSLTFTVSDGAATSSPATVAFSVGSDDLCASSNGTIAVDDLVRRDGRADIPYSGTDTGKAGTGLRLTSMGRLFDNAGASMATVWRIRNTNTAPATVRLDAYNNPYEATITVAGRTEAFVTSPVAQGSATHRLFLNTTLVDTKAAGNQDFNYDTVIDDPLCPGNGGGNTPPVVDATAITVAEDGTANLTLTATDADGDAVNFSVTTPPMNGALSGALPSVTYTPNSNFNGSDSFVVVANDGAADSVPFVVPVTVTAINDAPVADPAAISVAEDGSLSIVLTGSDVDGDTLTFSVQQSPSNGAVTGTAPNLTYAPAADFNGADSFTFVVSDGTTTSAPATVSVSVTAVNDAPRAIGQSVTVVEDGSIAITLTGTDADGDTVTFDPQLDPSNGSLTGVPPNLTYTPNPDFNGTDSFTFLTADGQSASGPATVAITVAPVNDAPIAAGQAITIAENETATITLAATDVDGDTLTFRTDSQPLNGVLSGAAPTLTYTPNANFAGSDSFTFVANDGTVDSAAVTVSITITDVSMPPVATAQSVTVNEDASLAITLAGTDPDGDALTFALDTQPINGSVSGAAPNITYTPAPDFFGDDSFSFTASDGTFTSDAATVTVTVAPVADAPTASAQAVSVVEDGSVMVTLMGADPDGDTLSFAVTTSPANGVLTGLPPNVTYVPNADFSGVDSFAFTASDGTLTSNPATVSITVSPANDAPIATAQAVTVAEDDSLAIVLAGTDVDGDALSFSIASPPMNGALTGTAPNLTYTPAADFFGSDSFAFVASDGVVTSAAATVSISISAVNDAPFADAQMLTTPEGTPRTLTLTGSDIDGDALTFTVTSGPSNGSLSGTAPNLTYTPTSGFSGSDAFTFVANDGTADSAAATVDIVVTDVNMAPMFTSTPPTTATAGVAFAYDAAASDPDGDTLTYALLAAPAGMTIDTQTGRIDWLPTVGGTFGVSVTATDPSGEFDTQTFSVNVSANTAPQFIQLPLERAAQNALYRSSGEVFDADGDLVMVELVAGPTGATLTPTAANRFDIVWLAAGAVGATETLTLRATDINGAVTEATVTLTIAANETNRSTLGTDFWLAHTGNFSYSGLGSIPRVSDERLLQIAIAAPEGATGLVEIDSISYQPGVPFSQTFDLQPGETVIIELPDDALAVTREDVSIATHVTSDRPIAVAGFNWANTTTDAWLAIPTPALGTSYQIGGYEAVGRGVEIQYTVVAVEPGDTVITITPEAGRIVRESSSFDNPVSFTLNVAGEVDTRQSNFHSGVQIEADKPIVVYAGSRCAVVPAETTACDHLVEQITPQPGLASEYIAAPLATRVNGSLYRLIATDDATTVEINGTIVGQIDNGERIDRFLTGPVHIVADKPLLALQFAPSNTYDNNDRPDGPNGVLADPFMLQLAPVDAYLSDYTFTVIDGPAYPNRPPEFPIAITSHYVNVTIEAADAGSLVLNGQPVDTSGFSPVGDTGFVAGTIDVVPGTYQLAANGLFGVVSYGFGPEESYGYYTGLAFPSSATGLSIDVVPQVSALEVGGEACFDFVVINASGEREPRARYTATIAGGFPTARVGFADDTGAGQFCYRQSLPGQDSVTLAVDADSETNLVDWLAPTAGNSLPPVFTSSPLLTLYDPTYVYPVTVVDPNGDTVTITLENAPTGMQYDAIAGQVVWTPIIPLDRESTLHSVRLTATDSNGQSTSQDWQLVVHYPPLITSVSAPTTATAQLNGTVGSIGGDFALLDARVADGPAAGSQIFWQSFGVTEVGNWAFTVNAFDVNTPETYAGFNRVCLAQGASQASYQVQRIRALSTSARYGSAVGPVVDTNNDGSIDNADDIYALSIGDTSATLDNLTTGQQTWSVPVTSVSGFSAAAIANLDSDPEMEFVIPGRLSAADPISPVALDTDGAVLWVSPVNTFASPQAEHERPLLVDDLNGDGSPEIIAGGYVLANGGSLLWQFPTATTGGVNVDDAFAIPVIVDLEGDGQKEVLFSNEVRRADGTLYWTLDATTGFTDPHAQFGLGDLNGDGNVDVVGVVSDGTDVSDDYSYKVFAWNGDGTLLWGPVPARGFSVPVVADVDADGDVEVYLVDDQQMISATGVVEYRSGGGLNNRDVFHRLPIIDLNGDGTYERLFFRRNQPFSVLGLFDEGVWVSERPIAIGVNDEELQRGVAFADVDHDGSLDIIVSGFLAVQVYASADQGWVGTARDFRQFTDSSNPLFGVDVPAAALSADKRADLWIGELETSIINDTQSALTVTVRNRGTAPVTTSSTVRFYRGAVGVGTDLGAASIPPLGIAESRTVTITVARSDVTDVMSAAIEVDPATTQCETGNDSVEGVYFEFDIFDLTTDYRTATDSLMVRSIEFATTPLFSQTVADTSVTVGQVFSAQTTATVTNVGEAIFYSLSRPSTLPIDVPMPVIDPATGAIAWQPTQAAIGTHTFTVNARSLQNRTRQDAFTLTVVPRPNVDPQITSSPPTLTVDADTLFTYNVIATDGDGDTLTYSLATAPVGMAIDSSTGVVTWTPTQADIGDNPVDILVDDGFGGSANQAFILNVPAPTNETPAITSTPAFSAKTGLLYSYQVVATDADGDPLTYSLTDAPVGMAVDSNGLITWTPATIGSATVVVRASDGQAFIERGWTITVTDGALPLDATLYISPTSVELGDTVSFTLLVANASGELTFDLTVDGVTVPMAPDGSASFVTTAVGLIDVSASVTDSTGTVTRIGTFTVTDPANATDAPVVELVMPGNEQEITAPTDIIGTVTDDNLADWTVFLLEANRPTSEAIVLATGTNTFNDAVIGQVDPTLLLNGLYQITLQAEDLSGNVSAITRAIRVTGDMKVGNFSISFEDLSVPVAGIPISVTRTYDSRQRNKSQDFGFGWTIDYQNVRVQESRDIGFSWVITQERFGLFGQTCVRPNGNPTVTVTLPDGEVETFQARAEPECSFTAQPFVNIVFDPVDFTSTSLRQTTFGLLRIINNNLVDPGAPGTPVDPTTYELTTDEGVIYELDQSFGIRRIIDTNDKDGQPNTLTYSDTGIVHSDGYALTFVRDGQGRIEEIQVPDGTVLQYDYDANGDLISFTDQENQVTTFTYRAGIEHYLEDILDPRGIRVARNLYDTEGRLEATIDADGNRIEYTHNVVGRTETIRDRRGNSTTYIYDDDGNVLSETNALGETTLRTYDLDRNVLTETDPLNNTTTFTYDLRGNVLTEADPLGNTTTSTYDSRNLLLTMTDPIGNVVATNTYDTRNTNLLTTTDALGQVTQFKWDSGIGAGCSTGASRGVINALLDETVVQPICAGPLGELPAWEEDERGTRTTFTYDTQGRRLTEVTTRTDENGVLQTLTTTFVYDDKGRLTQTTDAEGNVTMTEYNGIDKVSATVDALNRRTEMDYDARGNLVQTRYPDNTSEIMDYDENGNLVVQTDRDSRTTRMTYDAADRLIETIYPDATPGDLTDNPRTTNEYDAAGRLTAVIDERGNRTEYEYDAASRQTLIRNALNQITTHEYDARGLRTATIDDLGRRTTFVYDDLGRLVETIMPDGVTDAGGQTLRTSMSYDALGRKLTETDPAGEVTTFEYDEVGNLTAVIDALNQRTAYGYDEQNNKISQTDAELRTTTWSFDDIGRVTGRTLPLGQSTSYGYDDVGNRTSMTDFNNVTTTYTYNNVDRLTRTDHGDGRVYTMTYTGTGQLATAVDARGTTTYTYDERDRLTRLVQPDGRSIDYGYDAASNRTSLTTANQLVTTTYDVLNRPATVVDGSGTTTYGYDAVGNRASVDHANGTRVEYSYDTLNRLTELRNQGPAPTRATVSTHTYTLGDAGNRLSLIETLTQPDASTVSRTTAYTYDALYRLLTETVTDTTNGNRSATWTYDAVGNRQSEVRTGANAGTTTYVYDINDRLTSETTGGVVTAYTYDDNGNTLTKTTGGVEVASYGYDSEDRMTRGTITNAGNTTVTFYAYDVQGVRQSETTGGIARTYLVDPNRDYAQVIEEGDSVAGLERLYTFGDDLINQTRITGPTAADEFVDVYLYDGLGSVRSLSSEAAAITDTYLYEAFGDIDVQNGSTENRYLFTGEQYDPNVGFYYLRARYYDPSVGRFPTMDTFQGLMFEPATLHKYVYVHSNPGNMIDPSGLFQVASFTAAQNASAVLNLAGATVALATYHSIVTSAELAQDTAIARNCALQGSPRCRTKKLPVIIYGTDVEPVTQHIAEAVIGKGISPVLHRKRPKNNQDWVRSRSPCKGKTAKGSGLECDEYPFNSTHEGGRPNYRGGLGVSLKPLDEAKNSTAGNRLGSFYFNCGILGTPARKSPKSRFGVVPSHGLSSTITNNCGYAR